MTRHTKSRVLSIATRAKRFSHVHVDLVGLSSGFTHILTIIDGTTRWSEAVPLSTTSSVDCAKAYLSTWLSRFGAPVRSLLIEGHNLFLPPGALFAI